MIRRLKMSDISKISTELLKLKEKYEDFLSDQTFITTNNLVNKFYSTAKANKLWWYPPSISKSDVDDAIILEWWNNGKRLHIYILDKEIDYYAQWGVTEGDWTGQIESGDINIENDLTEFWEWIAE